MSEPAHQNRPALTRDEQKDILVLACRTDRLAWRAACRPIPQGPLDQAVGMLRMLEPLRPLLPGRVGSWMRGVSFLTNLGRNFIRFRA